MKAAICYEPGKPLVVEDGVEVDPPGKGEIKVRIAATAICHSDLHFMKGEIPSEFPGLAGHESSGYIVEIGDGVTDFKPGDPVILGTVTAGCGQCYYCTTGLRHFCIHKDSLTQKRHVNSRGQRLTPWAGPVGGLAEYTTVHQSLATKIDPLIPMDRAALIACGVTSGFGAVVNRAQVKPFSSVVVIGTGGVGLNSLQGAYFCGANPVIAVDILDSKLEASRQFGATHTINTKNDPDPVKTVMSLTSGRGADYVFVTVGNLEAIRLGVSMCGPRGMTVLIGLPMGNLAAITPIELIMTEKVITGAGGGSLRTRVDIPWLISLYQSGRLKLDQLVTAHYPLEKVNEAIASFERGEALRNIIMFE